MALKASIDIGTNSTRMLIVDALADGQLNPLEHQERITKLGAGLSGSGELDAAAMQRVSDVLVEYQRVIAEYAIQDVRVLATSATRDAKNRQAFLNLIHKKTGWTCRVLSGKEEAQFSFLGVVSDLDLEDEFLVCDVGGGSTEIILARNKAMQWATSLNVGSGRMTRQFLKSDPPVVVETNALIEFVQTMLKNLLERDMSVHDIIAVGGTAATLALIDSETSAHNSYQAHHYRLSYFRLQRIIYNLSGRSVEERADIVGLNPKRADVILAGALIFSVILDFYDCESMLVSLRDLMYGIFRDERE